MDLDSLICGNCKNEYNLTDRLPRLMMNCCGESVCSDCIQSILQNKNEFRCPYDGKPYIMIDADIEAFVVNPTLKRMIEKRLERERCPEHNEEYRFKCLNDDKKVCDICIHIGKHKGHDLISLKQAQSEVSRTKKQLETTLKDLDNRFFEIDHILKEGEAAFKTNLSNRFKYLREQIDIKEKGFESDIQSCFQKERSNLRKRLGTDSLLRKRIVDKIEHLKATEQPELSAKIRQDITQVLNHISPLSRQNAVEGYTQIINEFIKSFNSLLARSIEPIIKLELPTDDFSKNLQSFESQGSSSLPKSDNKDTKMPIMPTMPQSPLRSFVSPSVEANSRPKSSRFTNAVTNSSNDVNNFFRITSKGDVLVIETKKIHVKMEASEDNRFDVTKWKKMTKVRLRLDSFLITEERMKSLTWLYSQLEDVKSIKIETPYDGITDEELYKFCPVLFYKPETLKEIDLNFRKCKIADKSFLQVVENYANRLNSLEILRINLGSTLVTDKSIRILMKTAQSMIKNLEELELDLSKLKMEGLTEFSLFTDLRNMKRFTVNLYCTKITNSGLEAFFKDSLHRMAAIEELNIDLSLTNASEICITYLFVSMPTLKSLTLKLNRTKMTDKDLNIFAQKVLATLKNLESLHLEISETQVTDKSIENLFSQLQKLTSLKLYLGGRGVTDRNLFTLGDKLNLMKNLVHLELDIQKSPASEDALLKIFCILPHLQTLNLNLSETGMNDRCLKAFIEKNLQYIRGLKKFSMDLSSTKVGDNSVYSLLTQMKDVKSFRLSLKNTKISDAGVETFIKSVNKILKNPEDFDLDLKDTKVSNKIIDEVGNLKRSLQKRNVMH